MPLTRLKFASDNALLVEMFTNLLHHFGNSSDVHTSLSTSPYADEYRQLLLNNYAATIFFRYLQAVQKFTRDTEQLGLDIHSLSESQLADILTVMRWPRSYETDRDTCSGNFTIKALGWWQKIAGVSHLSIGFSPLVDSFLKTKLSKDRREAPPLPLWKIFHWERRIPQGVEIPYEVMMLGSFLLITWSDLRFADAQRLRVESLVFNFQELCGLVWRSKTMAAGHPFGAKAADLCSQGTFTWLFKFLQPDGTFQVLEPLTYAETAKIFREMLLTPWKKFQTQHQLANVQHMYTLHSMQATLLSFGPQLGALVSDSDRLLQGHHQDPKHSLNLYGSDSVWGSPRYQSTVITEIQKGWRPKTAQHRGGKSPLTEPLVTLARFQKNAPEYSFQWLPFSRPDDPHEHLPGPEVEQLDFDTESSSTSSGSDSLASATSTKTAKASVDIQVCRQADEEIFAKYRKVIHARVATTDDNDVRPFYRNHYWKAAFGARMLHVETDILPACGMQENLGLHPSGITQFEIFGTA